MSVSCACSPHMRSTATLSSSSAFSLSSVQASSVSLVSLQSKKESSMWVYLLLRVSSCSTVQDCSLVQSWSLSWVAAQRQLLVQVLQVF